MAAVGARYLALVGGLEFVVELLGDPLTQLGKQSLGVDARRQPLE